MRMPVVAKDVGINRSGVDHRKRDGQDHEAHPLPVPEEQQQTKTADDDQGVADEPCKLQRIAEWL